MTKLYQFLVDSIRTQYIIEPPHQTPITLDIGTPSSALDELLQQNQATSYAYITAHNPNSTSHTKEENDQRHQQLCAELDQLGFTYIIGHSQPNTDLWDPETCLLVLDITLAQTQTICQKYVQDAAVVGQINDVPKLFLTNPQLQKDIRILIKAS